MFFGCKKLKLNRGKGILGNCHRKHIEKVGDQAIFHRAQIDESAKQLFHRSHGLPFTSNYQIEVLDVSIDGESKTVGGNPACNMDTNRRDLTTLGVNTS